MINKRKERGADGKEDVKKKSWKENEGSVRGNGKAGEESGRRATEDGEGEESLSLVNQS